MAREVEVRSDAEVMRLLEAGNVHRAVAAHNLNDASSRSHAICTLQVPDQPHQLQDIEMGGCVLHICIQVCGGRWCLLGIGFG